MGLQPEGEQDRVAGEPLQRPGEQLCEHRGHAVAGTRERGESLAREAQHPCECGRGERDAQRARALREAQ